MMDHWLFKCKDVTQLVSQSMDEKLPFWTRVGIKMHLMVCHLCNRYKKQLDLIRAALNEVTKDPAVIAPKKLPEDVKEKLKRMLY